MMGAARVALAARVVTALVLVLLVGAGVREESADGDTVLVSASTTVRDIAEEVASPAMGALIYSDTLPPSRAVASLLGGAALEGRSVTLATPSPAPTLTARAPTTLVAGRRAALAVTVRGEPGSEVRLMVAEAASHTSVDTTTVTIGAEGFTTLGVGVEPTRVGVSEWVVRTGTGDAARVAAWVGPGSPLRVLVLAASPDWEIRYLVRALEAGGAEITQRQELGRDLVVTSGEDSNPNSLAGLARYDVVVTAGNQTVVAENILGRWVIERGGGLLVLGQDSQESHRSLASDLVWSAPAEWLPLPTLDIDVSGALPTTEASGSGRVGRPMATFGAGGPPVVTSALMGRGRLVVSGLETWPWVLEGGAEVAHSEYWHSVLDWLAGGLTSDVTVAGRPVPYGEAWEASLEGVIPPIVYAGANAAADGANAVVPVLGRLGRASLGFVPESPGAVPLVSESGDTLTAALIRPGDERLDWYAASVEIGESGGTLTSDPSLSGPTLTSGPRGLRRDWITFLLLGALMLGGWGVRRTNGLA